LGLSSALIFKDVEPLVAGNAVVERSGRDRDLERSVGLNLRLSPSSLGVVIDSEHVVGEVLAKHKVFRSNRLDLVDSPLGDLNVSGLATIKKNDLL
jgi:hypothetical protein